LSVELALCIVEIMLALSDVDYLVNLDLVGGVIKFLLYCKRGVWGSILFFFAAARVPLVAIMLSLYRSTVPQAGRLR